VAEIDGRVSWDRLDQTTFDRFVEALLTRLHLTDDPQLDVDVIDGRGGDGGIDIDVRRGDEFLHIYQLKFFPEGFSGPWAKARKPQIRKSFEAAMRHHPARWTLVVPRNPTVGERDFVLSLKKAHKVRLTTMGRAKLDALMGRFPDVQRWAALEPLTDALRTLQLERAVLAGPNDLGDAIQALHERADARSPNWTVAHSFSNGNYVETIQPKHRLAQQREPIGLTRVTVRVPKGDPLADRAQRVFDYGDSEDLTFGSEYLADLEVAAPSWSPLSETPRAPMLNFPATPSLHDPMPMEMQVLDEDDVVLRSYSGTTTHLGRGRRGVTLRGRLAGGIDVTFFMDFDDRDGLDRGRMTFHHEGTGLLAREAMRGVRFIQEMFARQKVRIVLDGNALASFYSGDTDRVDSAEAQEFLSSEFALLTEDLARLEEELGVDFPVPESITNYDRMTVRMARLLLDGKVILHPFVDTFSGTTSADIDSQIVEVIKAGAGAVFTDVADLRLEILGRRISLGTARYALPRARIGDHVALAAAITDGSAAGRPLEIGTFPGEAVRVMLPKRVDVSGGEVEITPWGVPGIPEHDELRGVKPAPPMRFSRAEERDGK
jgi:hypothetical protein